MKAGEKRFPDNQTPLQALVAARVLIEKPENWIKGDWGDNGKHCMMAALSRSCSTPMVWNAALHFLFEAIPDIDCAASFNDSHTHAEVLAAYDRAIAKAALEPEGERV